VTQWLRCCATNRKVAASIPAGVTWIFHWHKILPIALWPWGRLSRWRKWAPGAFPGGKGGRCVSLTTLPPPCAVVMKSGNLNFLEPSGRFQACNGTALPLSLWSLLLAFSGLRLWIGVCLLEWHGWNCIAWWDSVLPVFTCVSATFIVRAFRCFEENYCLLLQGECIRFRWKFTAASTWIALIP